MSIRELEPHDPMEHDPMETARSRMVPAVPFLIGLPLGWVCDLWRPWPIAHDPRATIAVAAFGALLVAAGLALIVGANRAMTRHGTSADIDAVSAAVVTTGPFAFSRNPIYLALAMMHVAIACFFDSVWMALAVAPALLAVDRIVVVGEERYLASRFGRVYLDYAAKVRRWL